MDRRRVLTGLITSAFLLMTASAFDGGGAPRGIRIALDQLEKTRTGRKWLERAVEFYGLSGPEAIAQMLEPGEVSRTDATLTRRIDPDTGVETREREVTIYLRLDQEPVDVVLDLVHELVHATHGPGWDPYDPALTVGRYIHSAIEGPGGEVAALAAECEVGLELGAKRCQRYRPSEGAREQARVDIGLIRQDFYRVGKWKTVIAKRLRHEAALFPLLSADKPELFSSTGNAPYPVALYEEYRQITEVACLNSRRRLVAFRKKGQGGRASASDPTLALLSRRCRGAGEGAI